MLKLRSIGTRDYSVYDDEQRIGRIRFADERMLCVWLWSVTIHLTARWCSRRGEPANSIYVPPCFLSFFTRCFW